MDTLRNHRALHGVQEAASARPRVRLRVSHQPSVPMLLDSSAFAEVAGVTVASVAALTGLAVAVHAYVRRLRRPAAGRPPLEDAQLHRLEHAVDAVAIEVERISEGQRFLTKVHAARGGSASADVGAER